MLLITEEDVGCRVGNEEERKERENGDSHSSVHAEWHRGLEERYFDQSKMSEACEMARSVSLRYGETEIPERTVCVSFPTSFSSCNSHTSFICDFLPPFPSGSKKM
ncbi:hypothetical protein EYF80_066805 [Liparis tanakae]|uniref:Uncharacterized protein n=1 Tax=Liparis tanakae TaxID=230148 RepID=A0A4Z2E2U4_9TELE|nr:hypothetical protein EYF80_066805 [Liparis tanakae]